MPWESFIFIGLVCVDVVILKKQSQITNVWEKMGFFPTEWKESCFLNHHSLFKKNVKKVLLELI